VTSDANGSLLAAEGRNQSNIWLASSDDPAGAKQITFGSTGEDNGWWGMVWSSDGKIIYTADTDSGTNIWSVDPDGKNKQQLTPAGGINNYPSVTTDSQHLVFQSNRGGHWAVWRLRLSDNDLHQLTGDEVAGEPFVSPDGKWIIYVNASDGTGELWRMSIDGTNATKLSNRSAEWPQVSPDGKYISVGLDNGKDEKLAILSIDGGEPLTTFDLPRLTNLRFGAQWTADGQALTYRDWANGVWRQSIKGGPPQRVDGLPQEKLADYAWSRDGKQLAFSRAVGPRDVVLIDDQAK
jgi:Tol biopolymer transport system component